MKDKHSSLPFSYHLSQNGFVVKNAAGNIAKILCHDKFNDGNEKADVELIVQACNSHHALVEAFEALLQHYIDAGNSDNNGIWNPDNDSAVIAARKALSLAKGQT